MVSLRIFEIHFSVKRIMLLLLLHLFHRNDHSLSIHGGFFHFTTVCTFVQTVDCQFVMSTTFCFFALEVLLAGTAILLHLLVNESNLEAAIYSNPTRYHLLNH